MGSGICYSGFTNRYIHLGAGSWVKGVNDRLKYEKARKLKGLIHEIRDNYEKYLDSSKIHKRECGLPLNRSFVNAFAGCSRRRGTQSMHEKRQE